MQIKYRGEELTEAERKEVANNLHISNHCKERLAERKEVDVQKLILNPLVAYFNTDGSMNFALTDWDYLVVVYNEYYDNFTAVTWKEMSWYGKNIWDKKAMAENGFDRKA